ncbi:MAG: hypothetical protein JO099_13375 [Acidobacteriia bacterium]|nr:hypothetical protein [Terriglobia bacterium]
MSCRPAVLAYCLFAVSCSRNSSQQPELERLAILRFENLSADDNADWMGRAFSQIITRDLAGVRSLYAIPFERLHSREQAFGVRPVGAPGISAERSLALAAGANRLGYGEYSVRAGKVEVRLTIEDPDRQKITQVFVASAAGNDMLAAADFLARQISAQASAYPTRNQSAVEAYSKGMESANPADRERDLETAIAADPSFGPPYLLLAQLKAPQDRAASLALLDRALSRKMPELDHARLAFVAANLRGESEAARQALSLWSRANSNDPEVWASIAADAMAARQYQQAIDANRRVLAIEPLDLNALNQLGYSAAYAGQLDAAMEALQRYQSLRPGDANPLDSMGDVNLILGRLKEAENFYLQAAKRDPSFLNGGDYSKAAMARLMTGDVSGADALAKQFADLRASAKDVMTDFQEAEWSWISGRRKVGFQQMQAFAQKLESTVRPASSQAYAQLAIWSVALGDRAQGAQLAARATALTTPASASLAAVAMFLAQPSASESVWDLRADRAFPNPGQNREKNILLSYALLSDKEFSAAARTLAPLLAQASAPGDGSLPVLLAWADFEAGKPKEAASLLRFNPIPSSSGVRPLNVFEFPNLFYLRGRIAALAGNPEQARSYDALFRKLSGDEPLAWDKPAPSHP